MKNRILTVSFALLSAQLFSQTIIENNINANTTWSQDGNPYIVNQTITVSNNITLSIEPGVIIKLNGTGKLFIVNGSINASGTSENPIIITHITDDEYGGDSNGDGSQTAAKINSWASIQINETSENSSHLNHCVFRFGGRVQGVVYADNCSPAINNCLFQYCENGIEINGFGSPSVKNNQFKNIENYPVAITPGVIPQFEGNTFSDNILTGLGLKKNTHTTDGDSLILSKTSIGGIKNATYIVQTPIAIDENTSLTIHPGIVIKKYYNNNLFQVNGSLIAEGIAEEPIVFTFITDDEFGGDTNNDANNTIPKKDSWASIQINETSANSSHLNHCVFRYGGRTNGSIYVQNSSPKIQNCYFKLCKNGLKIVNGNQLNISNLDFTDSETAIQLQNESEFVNIEKSKFSNNLLALEVISGLAKVDSCFFYKNENAIKVMGGNAIIHHSEFVENSKYHILNYTDKGIDATKNQWDENTIQELISSSNLTNVKQLYDH
ncbi:MAG TPA: right-handed parallel beta-helix repeat-containing protein, partial [Draconibacterium sp.]|nr:right-handed parallel beta-helix repeat-containing protein [Draconibacterium sp.]